MSKNHAETERSLLTFSVWMGVFFAVLGVCWGLAINSGAILFDGIYSGMSIILSIISLLALRMVTVAEHQLAGSGADQSFPFGRMAFEPLVVALKSIVIICVCVYGIVTSGIHLLHGGAQSTSSVLGMLYATISIIVCLFSWLYLKHRGKGLPDLVQAESEQWLIDTVFSGVVLVAFVLTYLLELADWKVLTPYIDPGVVILGSVYFIRVPLARCISSVRELLLMAPEDALQEALQLRIDAFVLAHSFTRAAVRAAKIGREITVEIAFLLPQEYHETSIEALDAIRNALREDLDSLGYKLWLNVTFTKDKSWA